MNIEELKTDRDLCSEQSKTLNDKLKQVRIDLERKEKVVYEWKGKYDNLLEKSSLELTDEESYQKMSEKLNDKIKKLKAEINSKDTIVDSLKSRLKACEDWSKEMEQERNQKEISLSKDFNDMNKKTEN